MKTHSIFRDKHLVKTGVPTAEIGNYLTAGARMISGNTIRSERDPLTGKEIEVEEIKAVYKLREGGQITILEEKV